MDFVEEKIFKVLANVFHTFPLVLHNSAHNEQVSPIEMQRQIEACRKSMSPSLGSFLLRTNKDESLRFGDLHLRFIHLNGYVPTGRQSKF